MDVLFVGLGSIGTRHLKNLHAVAAQKGIPVRAWALRSSARALPEETRALLAGEFTSLPEHARYDAAFITNPTHLHFGMLQNLRGKADTLFIEKPIFERTGPGPCGLPGPGAEGLCGRPHALVRHDAGPQEGAAGAVGVFGPGAVLVLPARLEAGVDYRTVYSAHKDMGGGVTIDLIHEWDYLVELFGKPEKMYNFKGTYSHLEIDSDDLSVYIAQYPTLLCEVHLDYFGREYRRSIELLCKNGTVTADFGAGTLTLEDGTVQNYAEPVNERYLREMAYFLDYAQSGAGPSVNTPETALDVLKLTLGEL